MIRKVLNLKLKAVREIFGSPDVFTVRPSTLGEMNPAASDNFVLQSKVAFGNNCPIAERTGDGIPCGRCWFYCPEGVCPRHGDVSAAIELFKATGKLTPEKQTK